MHAKGTNELTKRTYREAATGKTTTTTPQNVSPPPPPRLAHTHSLTRIQPNTNTPTKSEGTLLHLHAHAQHTSMMGQLLKKPAKRLVLSVADATMSLRSARRFTSAFISPNKMSVLRLRSCAWTRVHVYHHKPKPFGTIPQNTGAPRKSPPQNSPAHSTHAIPHSPAPVTPLLGGARHLPHPPTHPHAATFVVMWTMMPRNTTRHIRTSSSTTSE